jgi:hypothetical protein
MIEIKEGAIMTRIGCFILNACLFFFCVGAHGVNEPFSEENGLINKDWESYRILSASSLSSVAENGDLLMSLHKDLSIRLGADPTGTSIVSPRTFRIGNPEVEALCFAVDSHSKIGVNAYTLLYKLGESIRYQNIPTIYGRLDSSIKDLDNDGNPEILTNYYVAFSTDRASAVHGVRVWGFRSDKYVDVSEEFPDVYRHNLTSLKERIEAVTKLRDTQKSSTMIGERMPSDYYNLVLADLETARIVAMQNSGEREAGLDLAKKWIVSEDKNLRVNALTILSAITGPEVDALIESLSNDPDFTVSFWQKEVTKRRLKDKVDLEEKPGGGSVSRNQTSATTPTLPMGSP